MDAAFTNVEAMNAMNGRARLGPAALKSSLSISQVIASHIGAWDDKKSRPNAGDYWFCCPFHNERTPSFHVVERNSDAYFHCFGCGKKGSVIDFVAEYRQISFRDAIAVLSGNDTGDYRPAERRTVTQRDPIIRQIIPAPRDADLIKPERQTTAIFKPNGEPGKQITRYTPAMVFPYRDPAGELLGYVMRLEWVDDEGQRHKAPITVTWCEYAHEDGQHRQGWALKGFPEPKPLYRLEALQEMIDRGEEPVVLLVEGEKAANAAARIMAGTEFVPMAWPNGTGSYALVDFSPLKNLNVVYWPDADGPGVNCAANVGKLLMETVGVASFTMVVPPNHAEKGWDLADAEQEGWNKNNLLSYLNENHTTDFLTMCVLAADQNFDEEVIKAIETAKGDPGEDPFLRLVLDRRAESRRRGPTSLK